MLKVLNKFVMENEMTKSGKQECAVVPIAWFESLVELVEKAESDLKIGEPEPNYEISQLRLKLSPLIGYARSAKGIIKYSEKVMR